MEKIQEKAAFLKNEYTRLLSRLAPDAQPKWGKMNVLQMIEHMSDYVRIASGRTPMNIITPEENLPKMQGFLMNEKPMRENTPNPLMPDTPIPAKHINKQDAVLELQNELDYFFSVYEKEQGKKIPNPFFGELPYDMQVQLLYKHSTHHLRQFGAMES